MVCNINICDDIAEGFQAGPRRKLILEVTTALLSHQLVTSRATANTVFGPAKVLARVIAGSGMGLCHSGDLADFCFYHRTEKWLTRDIVRKKAGVRLHLRFRDDMVVVIDFHNV